MREHLAEGFRYDLWANRLWLDALDNYGNPATAEAIMRHILAAQHRWLVRCLSEEEVSPLPDDLRAGLEDVHTQWLELLRICDPGAFVSYETMAGDPHYNTVEQIARHVVNHGTYHRGHLRGLAAAEGLEAFPETDLIGYYRAHPTP